MNESIDGSAEICNICFKVTESEINKYSNHVDVYRQELL